MAKVIVYHRGLGCETGCCGHVVSVDGVDVNGSFHFCHPDTDTEEQVRSFVEQMVLENGCDPADLDWEHCIVTNGDICYMT